MATPAIAANPSLAAECAWEASSGEWAVTWTLTAPAPEGATAFRLTEVTTDPIESPVEGIIATDPTAGFPHLAGATLTGTQQVPDGASAASLTVLTEWDTQGIGEARATISIPADCLGPEPGAVVQQWSFTCAELAVTIDNSAGQEVGLRFLPSAGDPAQVGLAAGETATVAFPAAAGLAVDVQVAGQSIVDPADPIRVSPTEWAALTCDGGGGGDLPATGRPVLFVALGASLLLLLGTGLYLIARRRRIRFTA